MSKKIVVLLVFSTLSFHLNSMHQDKSVVPSIKRTTGSFHALFNGDAWEQHGTFIATQKPNYSFFRFNGEGFLWLERKIAYKAMCHHMVLHRLKIPDLSLIINFFFNDSKTSDMSCLDVSPDQKFLILARNKKAIILKINESLDGYSTKKKREITFSSPITTIATAGNKKQCILGNEQGTLYLLGYKNNLIELPKVHTQAITALAYCPQSTSFISCDRDGCNVLWNKNENNLFCAQILPFNKSITRCSLNNTCVALQHSSDNDKDDLEVSVLNVKNNRPLQTYKGALLTINEHNDLLIYNNNTLIYAMNNGTIEHYQLPASTSVIGNQASTQENVPFLTIKNTEHYDEPAHETLYKTEFFIPK